jgi:regulator of telomere elongation helicase 1
MGIPFHNRLENKHVISSSQIYVTVLDKGPAGHVLSSAYELRDSKKYIQDLGNSIANLAKAVPDGMLVFFTSYGALAKSMSEWKVQQSLGATVWDRINREKQIFSESKDKGEFKDSIAAYESAVSAGKGGIFLAVCRGKASEGLDFADKKARAVLICGIPFPFAKDPKVLLKKKILDETRGRGLTGNDWYNQQAARAVNQAIGRVIRHFKDYGAIILCDERFGRPHMIKQLPLWVRDYVDTGVIKF